MSVYKHRLSQMLGFVDDDTPAASFGAEKLRREAGERPPPFGGFPDEWEGFPPPNELLPTMTLTQALNSFVRVREWTITCVASGFEPGYADLEYDNTSSPFIFGDDDMGTILDGDPEPADESELASVPRPVYKRVVLSTMHPQSGGNADLFVERGGYVLVPTDPTVAPDPARPEEAQVLLKIGLTLGWAHSTPIEVGMSVKPYEYWATTIAKIGTCDLKFLDYEGEMDAYIHQIEGSPTISNFSASIMATKYWSHGGKYNETTGEPI